MGGQVGALAAGCDLRCLGQHDPQPHRSRVECARGGVSRPRSCCPGRCPPRTPGARRSGRRSSPGWALVSARAVHRHSTDVHLKDVDRTVHRPATENAVRYRQVWAVGSGHALAVAEHLRSVTRPQHRTRSAGSCPRLPRGQHGDLRVAHHGPRRARQAGPDRVGQGRTAGAVHASTYAKRALWGSRLSQRARHLRLDMSAEIGRTSSECSASPTATSPFPAHNSSSPEVRSSPPHQ